jgi:hypothetical protein
MLDLIFEIYAKGMPSVFEVCYLFFESFLNSIP